MTIGLPRAEIFWNSLRPPEAAMSGWAMSTQGPPGPELQQFCDGNGISFHLPTNKSLKPYLMKLHSPPAMGMKVLDLILL